MKKAVRTIKVLYAVHDKKSKSLDGFMLFNNDTDAIRAFTATCEKNDVFKKWPEDFQFVKIGDIDELGKFDQKQKGVVAEAKDYVVSENFVSKETPAEK